MSTRPDMSLEQIIDKITDAADLAATRADTLPVAVDRLMTETIGTQDWRHALWLLRRAEDRRAEANYTAGCWKHQRDCSISHYLGHYPTA